MAKTDNLTDFLTGVANAIRTKKGTTAKINPQNFETEIGSITASKPEQEKAVVPTNAQEIVLPDNGKTLSKVIVMSAPLPTSINSEYKYINSCLIATETKTLLLGCEGSLIPTDNSVTSIGPQAFRGCNITNMTIPDSVTSIGAYAFSECSRLRNVTIGNSVTNIGGNAFWWCTGLTSIVIPDSVININDLAFSLCRGITNVTMGSGVTSIGAYAFDECIKLSKIIIPKNVTYIGLQAFDGCSSLTNVTMLPTTPPQLGGREAFPSNVTTITVPVGCGEAYKAAEGWSAYADKIVEAAA